MRPEAQPEFSQEGRGLNQSFFLCLKIVKFRPLAEQADTTHAYVSRRGKAPSRREIFEILQQK